jgi:SAM-dependent methyltransferase
VGLGASDDLVPPIELIFDGTSTADEFRNVGDGFVRHFLADRARLRPNERVLDVGCGTGQKARPLSAYLSPAGSYDGFDIVADGIRWCQEAYARFPNFCFRLADILNTHYRPDGTVSAAGFRFPYEDARFDVVFLSSVFTHLLPRATENYLRETSRVLKPGGRCVITYFLLNEEARRLIDVGRNSIAFPHAYESGVCCIQDQRVPETAVAYEEPFVRALHQRSGLTILELTYGSWCGRQDLHGCLQDAVLSLKEDPAKQTRRVLVGSLGAAFRRVIRRYLE